MQAHPPEQLALRGVEPPPPPPADGFFLGIFPDRPARARIHRLASRLRTQLAPQARLPEKERFHVPLLGLGRFRALPQGWLADAQAALGTVSPPLFDVAFDRVLSLDGEANHRALVLAGGSGAVALRAFQQHIVTALARAGFAVPPRDFTPRITLLHDDAPVPEQRVEPITWTVREFVLVHSLLGRSRYVPLARWTRH